MPELEPQDWEKRLHQNAEKAAGSIGVDFGHLKSAYSPENDEEAARKAAELLEKKKGQD